MIRRHFPIRIVFALASVVLFLATSGLQAQRFIRGNCNAEQQIDISDPVFLLNFLFGEGAPLPQCLDACDGNDDGGLDISDPVYLLNFLFGGGPPLAAPFPNCGPDPTLDDLSCESFPPCPQEPEIPKPEVSGEPDTVYPAPIPVTPQPVPEPSDKSEFVQRLRFRRSMTTTVVLARMQNFSASERTVPTYVWPEEESLIVTKATILINEVLCGMPLTGTADVSYVGGRIGRRWLRTSLMTQDLTRGEAYVLLLTKVDGEYFLVGGKYEFLTAVPGESGKYQDYTGIEVTKREILGGCR